MKRITRMRLYIEEAILHSKRSTCKKKQVGAVAIRDGRVIATGYNGTLPGVNSKFGMDAEGNTKTVHAETNLIAYAAKNGIPLSGCTLYTTLEPCVKCAELLLQSGFEKIVFLEHYREHEGLELLVNSIIQVVKIELKGDNDTHNSLITKNNFTSKIGMLYAK